jgi:hypothetical protein
MNIRVYQGDAQGASLGLLVWSAVFGCKRARASQFNGQVVARGRQGKQYGHRAHVASVTSGTNGFHSTWRHLQVRV